MFKRILIVLTLLTTFSVLADTTGNATCLAEITRLDQLATDNGGTLDGIDMKTLWTDLEDRCATSTGDIRTLKAGLVYEFKATAEARVGTPASEARALKLLATSEALFDNCAAGGEYAKSCTILKDVVARMAIGIIAAREERPVGTEPAQQA